MEVLRRYITKGDGEDLENFINSIFDRLSEIKKIDM